MPSGGFRPGAGRKKGSRNQKNSISSIHGIETPLEFMLRIMNDPLQDQTARERMAVAAAPYIHEKKGTHDGKNKKNKQEERLLHAAQGKFAAGRSPLNKNGQK